MIRHIVDFSRRTCARMAGGCPGYGSGATANNTRRTIVTSTQKAPIPKQWMARDETVFRDVSFVLCDVPHLI